MEEHENALPHVDGFNPEGALQRLRGRLDRLVKYLSSFTENCSASILELQRHDETGDIEASARVAHQIKGTSANLGADALSRIAGELEHHYKNNQCRTSEEQFNPLQEQYNQLQNFTVLMQEHHANMQMLADYETAETESTANHTAPKEHSIVIIDDVEQDRLILTDLLDSEYTILSYADANKGMAALIEEQNPKPALVLLDVEMPGKDGYEVCREIKANPETAHVNVIFLSGRDSTEEIIQGLDCGASDYITKPFDPVVLQSKIKASLQLQQQHQQLAEQANNATQLIHTFISESSSLGALVNFFRKCFTVTHSKELMSALLNALESAGLSCVVYFRSDYVEECASTSGDVLALEYELLSRLYGHNQPFVEKGSRLFVTQKKVAVLIKNTPEDDDKLGSLKDHLMILLEGTNEKINFLDQTALNSSQKGKKINQAIVHAITEMDRLQLKAQGHMKDSLEILDHMIENIESSIFSMGLTEEQEDLIIKLLQSNITDSQNKLNECLILDEKIRNTVIKLSKQAKDATQ